MKSSACSGAVFCLDATANTALPGAATSRAGLYLRYSALRAIGATDQHVTCFRGTAETARSAQVQMHNRWNPELNVQAVPGYTQLLRGSDGRLAERCLWTGRIALPDTWESVTLLCVPMLDSAGNVRGICGAELSDLYFRLTYPAVDSAYGSMVTVLAPIDGDRLLLGQAMIGSPGGSYLTADGTLTCKTGRYYNTYSDGSRTYLGLHEPIGATDAAGRKLAAVVLVPVICRQSFGTREYSVIYSRVSTVFNLIAAFAAMIWAWLGSSFGFTVEFIVALAMLVVILLLGLCSLFWHTSITGMVVLLVLTYALEIVVDNVCARMTWGWMLKHAFGITLGLAIFNILWLYVR